MGDLAYAPYLRVVRECASADACQPSLHSFLSSPLPLSSPTQCYSTVCVASLTPFIYPFSSSRERSVSPVDNRTPVHTCSFSPTQTSLYEDPHNRLQNPMSFWFKCIKGRSHAIYHISLWIKNIYRTDIFKNMLIWLLILTKTCIIPTKLWLGWTLSVSSKIGLRDIMTSQDKTRNSYLRSMKGLTPEKRTDVNGKKRVYGWGPQNYSQVLKTNPRLRWCQIMAQRWKELMACVSFLPLQRQRHFTQSRKGMSNK